MPTFRAGFGLALLAVCLLATDGRPLLAAPPVDVVSVDLAPLIDRAAESPSRFAIDIPHRVSTVTSGEWSRSASTSTWTYSAQIPGAVSMSFHATDALLPSSATLIVTADGVDYVYTSGDAPGGALWSRIGRGDSLRFELTVATEDIGGVRLEIASFQAGYRSLGEGVRNHLHYDDLRKHALANTAPCAENWTCNVTATNTGPGNATAALVINNTYLCTGVLLNDVPSDGAPYLLTARHCQNGSSDGGDPSAAGSIVVYWNAVTACGSPLGNIYNSGSSAQLGGADTVVEQQDAWLVRLRSAPIVDAYYAGWDATGGTFVGGFSPHHADGTSRQFVGWYGQAVYFTVPAEDFGLKYASTFWGTVNALGTGGPGSSGAGLFDDSGHLVGTVVRGRVAADDTGVCPASPPPAPTQSNAVALSTALSGIFNSTADPGSSTGAATLQKVLDPGQTGTLVQGGNRRPVVVTVSTYANTPATGTLMDISWSSSPFATSCTATGGEPGDGWPGTVATTGSKMVTSLDGGDVTYTVSCTDGQRTGTGSVIIHWALAPPNIYMTASVAPVFGVPFNLIWNSNVRPCTATGGIAGDGWGGAVNPTGSKTTIENVVGPVTYTLTCGTGSRVAKQDYTPSVFAPLAAIVADAVTLRVGERVNISTTERGAPCARTGGATGDGWAGPGEPYGTTVTLTESAVGTYTYAVACGSGAYVASAQVNVTFTNNAPAVSIQMSSTTGVVNVDAIKASWDSNIRPCRATITDPTGHSTPWDVGPHSDYTFQETIIGQYVFDVACGSGTNTAHASAAMTWTGTPSVQATAPTAAVRGVPFYVSYFANIVPCTTSGGAPGDSWAGQFNEWSHTKAVVEQAAGTYTYTVTCGSGSQIATDHVSVDIVADAPQVTLTAIPEQQVTGRPITVSWSSNTSQCNLFGGAGGGSDGWPGTRGGSGSITLTETRAENYLFAATCGKSPLTVTGTILVTFRDVAAPTFAASKSAITVGETVTLTWASADGSTCFGQGNATGWYGIKPSSGSFDAQLGSEGNWYFGLSCGASLTATVYVRANPVVPPPPTVSLTASPSSLTLGDSTTLTYTVSNADGCSASGGSPGDEWTGSVAKQGGNTFVRPTTDGVFNYTITCVAGSATASASAPVNVSRTASPSSGGGGGGGSMGPVDLAFFLSLGVLGYWRRRRTQDDFLRSFFARCREWGTRTRASGAVGGAVTLKRVSTMPGVTIRRLISSPGAIHR